MGPPCCVLIPGICECYLREQKGLRRYTVRILSQDYAALCSGLDVVTRVLMRGKQTRIRC